MTKRLLVLVGALAVLLLALITTAQTTPSDDPNCDPAILESQYTAIMGLLPIDFAKNPAQANANLFKLSLLYQQIALSCGYAPTEDEVGTLLGVVFEVTDLETIILSSSIGDDTEAIMTELEMLTGNPMTGQLLYNGLENGLDGGGLGCAGCHNGQTAPSSQATWTRVTEVRLQDPALAGYTVEQYLIESIVHPNAYISPDYQANLMPDNYGKRLDAQQLADLVAYLDSQDQLE